MQARLHVPTDEVQAAVEAFARVAGEDGAVAERALEAVVAYALDPSPRALNEAIDRVVNLGDAVYLPRHRHAASDGYRITAKAAAAHTKVRRLLQTLATADPGHARRLARCGLSAGLIWVSDGNGSLWLFSDDEPNPCADNRLGSVHRVRDGYRAGEQVFETLEEAKLHVEAELTRKRSRRARVIRDEVVAAQA